MRFVEAKITGYDFPELLEGDGRLLESHLGLSGAYERRRVQRGMRMKLMGMGRPPLKPFAVAAKSRSCSSIVVEWKSDAQDASFPIHKFVLQRRQSATTPRRRWWGLVSSPGNSSAEGHWRTVYEGMETRFEETGLATDELYSYRIVAWNVIGRSEYEYVSERTVTSPCAKSDSWFWVLYVFFERLLQFLVAAVAFVASASRLSSSSEGLSNSVFRPVLTYLEGFADRLRYWGVPVPPLCRRSPLLEYRSPSLRKGKLSVNDNGATFVAQGPNSHLHSNDNADDDGGSPTSEIILSKKFCSVCREKFSDWDRRVNRHLCSSCHGHFHAKCGTACHGPFFPCPVQGGCKCEKCREECTIQRSIRSLRSVNSSDKLDATLNKRNSSIRSLLRKMNSNLSCVTSMEKGGGEKGGND